MTFSRGIFDPSKVEGNVWDKQFSDTPLSFEAFVMYRDAGPHRSLTPVSEKLGKRPRLLYNWSSKYAWMDRVAAWDAHNEAIKADMLKRAIEMKFKVEADRTADMLCLAKDIAMHDLEVLQKKILQQRDRGDPGELFLSPNELIKFIDRVTMLERVITGQTTSNKKTDETKRTLKMVVVEDKRPHPVQAAEFKPTG